MVNNKVQIVLTEKIEKNIFLIRGQKVILSNYLAEMYNVETRVLVQAVKRNIERFPKDFMFQLNESEMKILKSQIVISSWGGARRARPYAFTEQGVAMLSSVLKSKKAIKVNIEIIRAFVKLRAILSTHLELAKRLKELELKYESHDQQIASIFEAINQMLQQPEPEKRKIGFTIEE